MGAQSEIDCPPSTKNGGLLCHKRNTADRTACLLDINKQGFATLVVIGKGIT